MALAFFRALAAPVLFALSVPVAASAQSTRTIPAIVVTPYYQPTALGKVGSAVTVITRDAIAASSATTVSGLLRTVPGVTVIESGGPGSTAEVRLRGAETGHTVVLIDGVRVNDPATARNDFDFSLIALGDVDRIEVLRGPQSATYGSDAMGGVVNIITRKPLPGTNFTASGELGSYGTNVQRLSGGTASGNFRFLLSGEHAATHGFSRVGDRDRDEADGMERWSGSLTGAYEPTDGPRVEVGLRGTHSQAGYDGAPPSSTTSCIPEKLGFAANAPNEVTKGLLSGYGRITWPGMEGDWQQSVTAFGALESRGNTEFGATFGTVDSVPCQIKSTSERQTAFRSHTIGAEYQTVGDVGGLGTVLIGSRIERELATYSDSSGGFNVFDSDRSLYALFVQDQVTIAERLNLSFTGRYDGEIGGEGFLTGRATAAYGIPATGTKLRASAGSAAKRPTAYMTGNNLYAAGKFPLEPVPTDLKPERSFGVDAGIDQSLFDGRLIVSVTGFYNRFNDLLTFKTLALGADFIDGYYENVANASTAGVEVSGSVELVPGRWHATGSYTYLEATNLDTGYVLPRRPKHTGSVALTYTGGSGLEATLSAVLVGARFNRVNSTTGVPEEPLPGYARLDLEASYPLNPSTRVYGRIENLTNAAYEDPRGYNTAGLSAYVGLRWKN